MIIDTFSKRQKRLSQQTADVFTYDDIPKRLRIQIIHVLDEALGKYQGRYGEINAVYQWLHKKLAAEFGLTSFSEDTIGEYGNCKQALFDFFRDEADTNQALDIVEVLFRAVVKIGKREIDEPDSDVTMSSDQAVQDLNHRFLENACGYAFIGGDDPQLIRKDNEHLHQEAVMPALHLLHEQGFEGANDEYRSAHEHYRHGKYKECLNDCLKAFESTLKTICEKRGWTYQATDTAKTLIKTCLDNRLLPAFADSHLTAIRTNLEGTIPTVRNKLVMVREKRRSLCQSSTRSSCCTTRQPQSCFWSKRSRRYSRKCLSAESTSSPVKEAKNESTKPIAGMTSRT